MGEQLPGSLSCEPACGGSDGHERRAAGGKGLNCLVGTVFPFQSSVFHSLVEINLLEPTEFGTSSAQNIIALKTQTGQTQARPHIPHFPDMLPFECQTHLRDGQGPSASWGQGLLAPPQGSPPAHAARSQPCGKALAGTKHRKLQHSAADHN